MRCATVGRNTVTLAGHKDNQEVVFSVRFSAEIPMRNLRELFLSVESEDGIVGNGMLEVDGEGYDRTLALRSSLR